MNTNSMLIRNLSVFTESLGTENAALIWYLSTRVQWEGDDDRDEFIKDLTGEDPRVRAAMEKVQ